MISTFFNLACYVISGILILLAGSGLFINLWQVFSVKGMWKKVRSAVSVILMICAFIKIQGEIHSIWISLIVALVMALLGINDDSETTSTSTPQPTEVYIIDEEGSLDYYVAKDAARMVYEKEYKNR